MIYELEKINMKNNEKSYNMKKLKFILVLLVTSLLLVGCGTGKHVTDSDNIYGVTRMYYTMNRVLGTTQLDSLITADRLAPLNTWIYSPLIGDRGKIKQWLYIKSLNEKQESIYTVTQMDIDTLYKCTKRVTEEIK